MEDRPDEDIRPTISSFEVDTETLAVSFKDAAGKVVSGPYHAGERANIQVLLDEQFPSPKEHAIMEKGFRLASDMELMRGL